MPVSGCTFEEDLGDYLTAFSVTFLSSYELRQALMTDFG